MRRRHNATRYTENTGRWRDRKYCSTACAQRAHPGPGIKHGLTKPKPRKHPTTTPAATPPKDGLTPHESLQAAATVHPLLLEYIANPPKLADGWEIHTHIGFGTLENEAAA